MELQIRTPDFSFLDDLTPEARLELEAKLLGYKKMPPTIRQFINDNYYLGSIYGDGKLYNYWLPILEKIFPTPIHIAYNTVVLTGCLGSGKSTVSRVMAAYIKCRLDHMENFNIFDLAKGKDLVMSYFHTTGDLVANTFTEPLEKLKEDSPYFKEGKLSSHKILDRADTPRGKGPIGADVLFYVFSEINFVKPNVAKLKLDTAFNRLVSRFLKMLPWFGLIILDSSAAEGGSFVDEFVEKHSNPATTLVVRSTIWEVKKDKGIYGNPKYQSFKDETELQNHFNLKGKVSITRDEETFYIRSMSEVPEDFDYSLEYLVSDGWFKVYLGDSTRDAFIVNESEVLDSNLDPDRFLNVPVELEDKFQLNLELSLQDHAGISTKASNVFIMNRESIPNTFKLPMRTHEVIEVDFYDRNDRLYNYLEDALKYIPKQKVLSVRFDIGVVSDYTGLAISYFDDYVVKDKKNKTLIPKFCTPIACAIGRKQNQETSISMLYEFVKDLSKEFEIGIITADSYQSRQLEQDLERDGFNFRMLSVDKKDDAYQYTKLAMYEDRVKATQSKLLQREVRELIYVDNKVDHPPLTKADNLTYGKGSKDVADAWAGSIYAMTYDLEAFTYISKHYNRESYLLHMKRQTVTNKDTITKDMKKLMKTGGMDRFMKKEQERRSLLTNIQHTKLATDKSHRRYKSQFIRSEKDYEDLY